MRTFLIVTCLANIAFAFGSLLWMPEKIAVHFALDGTVNRFEPPHVSAILMSVIACFITASILGLSFMMSFIASNSPETFKIPNSDYWFNEENRPKTIRRYCSIIESPGVAIMLFLLLVQWELFRINQTVPPEMPNTEMLMYAGGILLALIVFESVRLFLYFRLPKEKD
jgi:uncharacterized membrane protein